MAYGDGLMLLGAYFRDDSAGEEITTNIPIINADDAAQDIWKFRSPFQCTVLAFGAYIEEVGAAASTDAVLSLDVVDATASQTRTEKLTISFDATAWSLGDGKIASVTAMTADTDLTVGRNLMYTGTALPFVVKPGETLVAEHKTAGNGSTLSYQAVALVRIDGYDLAATNVATLNAAAA